jgi:hypothetical protein
MRPRSGRRTRPVTRCSRPTRRHLAPGRRRRGLGARVAANLLDTSPWRSRGNHEQMAGTRTAQHRDDRAPGSRRSSWRPARHARAGGHRACRSRAAGSRATPRCSRGAPRRVQFRTRAGPRGSCRRAGPDHALVAGRMLRHAATPHVSSTSGPRRSGARAGAVRGPDRHGPVTTTSVVAPGASRWRATAPRRPTRPPERPSDRQLRTRSM